MHPVLSHLDFANKDVFKPTGIRGPIAPVKIKPNLLQQGNKSVTIRRNQVRLLAATKAMAKLHRLGFHNDAKETLHFGAFLVGDNFLDARFRRIIVEQSDKRGICGSTESSRVNVRKERILGFIFLPVRLLSL